MAGKVAASNCEQCEHYVYDDWLAPINQNLNDTLGIYCENGLYFAKR